MNSIYVLRYGWQRFFAPQLRSLRRYAWIRRDKHKGVNFTPLNDQLKPLVHGLFSDHVPGESYGPDFHSYVSQNWFSKVGNSQISWENPWFSVDFPSKKPLFFVGFLWVTVGGPCFLIKPWKIIQEWVSTWKGQGHSHKTYHFNTFIKLSFL